MRSMGNIAEVVGSRESTCTSGKSQTPQRRKPSQKREIGGKELGVSIAS
jgi:hypothetical protein